MSFTPAPEFTTRPTLTGRFGMSASTHWLATASAQSVLEQGGNAFDAVVAGAFVLHVVEPHLNGPGGDMVGIFATAGGAPTVLMGQGPAPAGASAAAYRELGLELVPGAGALAAAIPGAVDAWLLLLRDHGTWELPEVLQFAIGYARHGHPVLDRVTATIEKMREHFEDHWPSSAALWGSYDGTMPELAGTYERLAASSGSSRVKRIDAARMQWSEGFVAQAIDDFVRVPHRHSDGHDYAGVLTARDLAGFSASFESPVTIDFRGHTIAKSAAWGQGPALLQMLAILDGFGDIDPSTPLGAHTILEVEKLALADRDAWFGDTGDVPLETLLSGTYVSGRRLLVGDRASRELRPGSIAGRTPFRPPLTTGTSGMGEPTVSRQGVTRGDTCHIDVIDRWGNIVSATPSGGWLQSSPAIPGLGFCLGTRLQMTWLQDGAPATLTPGRRPRTTLTPTLVLREGRAVTALGSPGGDQQDTWQLLYLLRTIVGGYTPQQAIDAPAYHTTSFPDSFWPRQWEPGGAVVEDRLGATVIDSLESRGHVVTRAGDWALGRLSAVGTDDRGMLWSAANARGNQGYAAGR
ncbi:transferase [Salinibacterium xinjiangense]|nr:gamma-glutamyltransferase [Salinibacterium xinjiangense]GGK84404.1 transferase [Salinibacterium xinjiangense]